MKRLQCFILLPSFFWIPLDFTMAKSEVFRWTDDSGRVHYSEKKPRRLDSESIRIKNTASSDAPRLIEKLEQKRIIDSEAKNAKTEEAPAAKQQASEDQCAQVRKNLETLTTTARIKKKDPDTQEVSYLDDQMRKSEQEQNQKFIELYCSGS